MTFLLETQQLAVGYRGETLLEQIDFRLKPKQICCLLGANGTGKSTLLKTLLGLQPAISGQILLHNQPLTNWTKNELAKQIAYVPQAHHSFFAFSVLEMVLMGRSAYLTWYQTPTKQDRELAYHALESLDIAHLAERHYAELSGGEKQLVLIARALAQDTKLLIMDEPTASLDFGNQIRLLDKIKQLRAEQRSLIITTHSPQQADYLADAQDTVVMLNKNALPHFAQGDKQRMLNVAKLAEIYRISPAQLRAYLNW